MIFKTNTFKKTERLCSRKVIEQLVSGKQTNKVSAYPLLLIWKEIDSDSVYPAQIVISVSKKYSKLAVKRNLIKRQLREIYRTNKDRIYSQLAASERKAAFMLIFTGKEKISFSNLTKSFTKIIEKFIQHYQQSA